jgi:hypothetical protein
VVPDAEAARFLEVVALVAHKPEPGRHTPAAQRAPDVAMSFIGDR